MAAHGVPTVDDTTYEAEVLKAPAAVVDFWGDGWHGCEILAPVVEQAAKDYAGKLKIVSANVADTGDTASGLGIFSIPTLVFYKAGKEVGRTVGAISRAKLGKEIASKLGVS